MNNKEIVLQLVSLQLSNVDVIEEDTIEELELCDNNDQATMEMFKEGSVIWSNFEQDED